MIATQGTGNLRSFMDMRASFAAIVATARLANAFAILGKDRRWRNRPLGMPYLHVDDILALA